VLIGIVLFFIANAVLWYARPLSKVDPESLPAAHTWTWWATKEYLEQAKAPDVVLLGSSLMMHPISRLDADFHDKNLDYVHHHRSDYLASQLKNSLGLGDTTCFNFALPGSMLSDDYMVTKGLLRDDRCPKVLVLGLSLRDFIDSGVSCPAATPPFKYLMRFVDINDITAIAMPEIWRRLDYYTGNLVYLWSKKLDLQVILTEGTKSALSPLAQRYCAASLIEQADPAKNLPSNLRSEVEEHMFIVNAHQPYSWEDNSAEYAKRYRVKHKDMFEIQKQFLSRLLDCCKERHIAVLLVNMPLSDMNMNLMPAHYYDSYVATMKEVSQKWNCPFLDMNADRQQVNKADFYDTAHMNSTGGKKLADRIASWIVKDPQLADSLTRPAAMQVAETAARRVR
jgi:hypothetical protein